MAFKQDEDFLRFLTMGAGGSKAAADDLNTRGHRMVGLDRGSMGNKIWETKVKRLRVPDLMCVDCGLRVEARAKSDLKIRLSDSSARNREWNYGLRDSDVAAFIPWSNETATASKHVEYFTAAALNDSVAYSKVEKPKSQKDGAERDRVWPSRVFEEDVEIVDVQDGGRLVKARELATGTIRTRRFKKAEPARAYVSRGDIIRASERLVAGLVAQPQPSELACKPGWVYQTQLSDPDNITRYIAVKMAGIMKHETLVEPLVEIDATDTDARVRLEARGSLARIRPHEYTRLLKEAAFDARASLDPNGVLLDDEQPSRPLDEKMFKGLEMEAMFILAELMTDEAGAALLELARDASRNADVRSAAVWGLGTPGLGKPELLLEFVADDNDVVALHALAAIGVPDDSLMEQAAPLIQGSEREAASAVALLRRQGIRGAAALLDAVEVGGTARTWALGGLGQMAEQFVLGAAGGSLHKELLEVLKPMWTARSSWLRNAEPADALTLLERQTVRHSVPEIVVAA